MGGLSKKSFQLKEIRRIKQAPGLNLDAGNLLFKQTTIAQPQELIAASGIVDIYRRLAFDAVAVGPHDMAAGLGFLQETAKKGFPWLSANVLGKDQKPLFKPSLVIQRGGLTVGIIGLTSTTTRVPRGVTVGQWQNALSGQLAVLAKTTDLVVVLSTLSEQENFQLARSSPQVHILLSANSSQGNIQPRIVNNTLITQTHSQGKYLGFLDLDWQPQRQWEKDLAAESLLLHDRLGVLDRQILRAERESVLPGGTTAKLEGLRQERQILVKGIEEIKERSTQSEKKRGSGNSFQHSFIALAKDSPEDQEISAHVNTIKEQLNAHNQKSATIAPLPKGYSGFVRCGECHAAQTEFWKNTRHAQAFQTLVRQRQNFNLDCLPCHVTLADHSRQEAPDMQKKLISLPAVLQGIGCESCHDPGAAHAADPELFRTRRQVADTVCLSCHSQEQSPGFDYARKISGISCPAD